VIGRFLQPDTIVPEPANPQSLNRYSYVYNNPLRYTDPTGHRVDFQHPGTLENPSSCDNVGPTHPECGSLLPPPPTDNSELDIAPVGEISVTVPRIGPGNGWLTVGAVALGLCTQFDCGGRLIQGGTELGHTICGFFSFCSSDGGDGDGRSLEEPESLEGATVEELQALVPEGWVREPTSGEGGLRWQNPATRKTESLRWMPGNPADSEPVKRGPYIRYSDPTGRTYGPYPAAGNPLLR